MNVIPSQPLEPESRPLAERESLVDIITSVQEPSVPQPELLQRWAVAAMELDKKFLAVKIVSNEEMSALNLQFSGKDKSTNVLSFPAEQWGEEFPEFSDDADSALTDFLGDIAVCADVVEREAREQNKTPHAHWAHMIVHGVLHLRGFDHIVESDAELMESREVQILATLGFPDPYLPQHNSGNEVNTHS